MLLLLEEQGLLNRTPDDIALCKTFNTIHMITNEQQVSQQVIYNKSKFGMNGFVIKHFAGLVNYTIDGFLIKNNDSLQDDLIELMAYSTNTFLKDILNIGIYMYILL